MPHWRKTSWAIAVWTVLMFLWMGAGFAGGLENASQSAAYSAGMGIGVFLLFFIYVLGLVPLALLWFGTRPRA
jgi:hypothetical protein